MEFGEQFLNIYSPNDLFKHFKIGRMTKYTVLELAWFLVCDDFAMT